MKLRLLFSACFSCLALTANAQQAYQEQPSYGYGSPPEQIMSEVADATAVLEEGLGKLLAFFNGDIAPSPEQIAVFVDREIAPYFNFSYMARWAAGGFYRTMTDQEIFELENDIKSQFLAAMSQKLSAFRQQTVRFLPPKIVGSNKVSLGILIGNPGEYPSRLDFRMYQGPHGWQVFDVAANGSSAIMYYRQYYSRLYKMRMMQ